MDTRTPVDPNFQWDLYRWIMQEALEVRQEFPQPKEPETLQDILILSGMTLCEYVKRRREARKSASKRTFGPRVTPVSVNPADYVGYDTKRVYTLIHNQRPYDDDKSNWKDNVMKAYEERFDA